MRSSNRKERREAFAMARRKNIKLVEAYRRIRAHRAKRQRAAAKRPSPDERARNAFIYGGRPHRSASLVPHGARPMAILSGKQGRNLYEGTGAMVAIRVDDPGSWDRAIYTVICAVHGSRGRSGGDYAMELLTDRIYEARHEYLRLKDDPAKAKHAYMRHWGHPEVCECPLCKKNEGAKEEVVFTVPDDPDADAAAKGRTRYDEEESGEWDVVDDADDDP
jgi:hypothetical protein